MTDPSTIGERMDGGYSWYSLSFISNSPKTLPMHHKWYRLYRTGHIATILRESRIRTITKRSPKNVTRPRFVGGVRTERVKGIIGHIFTLVIWVGNSELFARSEGTDFVQSGSGQSRSRMNRSPRRSSRRCSKQQKLGRNYT